MTQLEAIRHLNTYYLIATTATAGAGSIEQVTYREIMHDLHQALTSATHAGDDMSRLPEDLARMWRSRAEWCDNSSASILRKWADMIEVKEPANG